MSWSPSDSSVSDCMDNDSDNPAQRRIWTLSHKAREALTQHDELRQRLPALVASPSSLSSPSPSTEVGDADSAKRQKCSRTQAT